MWSHHRANSLLVSFTESQAKDSILFPLTAQNITGTHLQSISDTGELRCLQSLFSLLPSSKRYGSIRCCTTRCLRDSFVMLREQNIILFFKSLFVPWNYSTKKHAQRQYFSFGWAGVILGWAFYSQKLTLTVCLTKFPTGSLTKTEMTDTLLKVTNTSRWWWRF